MVSRTDDTIDFNKLEQELTAALDADEKYSRENAAKFRAIEQKVATYEEFRDIVLASNLKPLEKRDLFDGKWKQPWNAFTQLSKTSAQANTDTTGNLEKNSPKKPTNGHAFARDWRRLCKSNTDKYMFLLWVGGHDLAQIFKTEISFGLLGDILTALSEQYDSAHRESVMEILDGLSRANRFALSVDFLSQKEKEACKILFDKIQDVTNTDRKLDDGDTELNTDTSSSDSCPQSDADEHSVRISAQLRTLVKKYGLDK